MADGLSSDVHIPDSDADRNGLPRRVLEQILPFTECSSRERERERERERGWDGLLRSIECSPRGRIGYLNPEWIEWLMGYPIGWTELDASETP